MFDRPEKCWIKVNCLEEIRSKETYFLGITFGEMDFYGWGSFCWCVRIFLTLIGQIFYGYGKIWIIEKDRNKKGYYSGQIVTIQRNVYIYVDT